jgi:hypothetical protein
LKNYTGFVYTDYQLHVNPVIETSSPQLSILYSKGKPIYIRSDDYTIGFTDGRPRKHVSWGESIGQHRRYGVGLEVEVDETGRRIHLATSDTATLKRLDYWYRDGAEALAVERDENGEPKKIIFFNNRRRDTAVLDTDRPEQFNTEVMEYIKAWLTE